MVRQLQLDIEKNKPTRKIFPARKASKEFTKNISESLRTKIGKSDSENSLKFWKTFEAKPVLDECIFPLPVSSKFSSSQMAISSSVESIPRAAEKSDRSEKIAAKKESQVRSNYFKNHVKMN